MHQIQLHLLRFIFKNTDLIILKLITSVCKQCPTCIRTPGEASFLVTRSSTEYGLSSLICIYIYLLRRLIVYGQMVYLLVVCNRNCQCGISVHDLGTTIDSSTASSLPPRRSCASILNAHHLFAVTRPRGVFQGCPGIPRQALNRIYGNLFRYGNF